MQPLGKAKVRISIFCDSEMGKSEFGADFL